LPDVKQISLSRIKLIAAAIAIHDLAATVRSTAHSTSS